MNEFSEIKIKTEMFSSCALFQSCKYALLMKNVWEDMSIKSKLKIERTYTRFSAYSFLKTSNYNKSCEFITLMFSFKFWSVKVNTTHISLQNKEKKFTTVDISK